MSPTLNLPLLDAKLAELQAQRTWSPALWPPLREMFTTASDEALTHLNPLAFAAAYNLPEQEVVESWLYATKLGLLEMRWHLLCIWCGNLTESFRSLSSLHGHFVCRACGVETEGWLDDSILVNFAPARLVRETRFHHPERLSAADLYQTFYLSSDVLPFTDGRRLAEIDLACTRLCADLPTGETLTLTTPAWPGMFYLTDVTHQSILKMSVVALPAPEETTVRVKIVNGKFHSLIPPMALRRTEGSADYPPTVTDQFAEIPAGNLQLEITNASERPAALRLQLIDDTYPLEPVRFRPFLTGKWLLTSQTFRDLFRVETVTEDEKLKVRDITFLFTDLKDSTTLYESVGDPEAYWLVRQHFQLLTRIVAEHHGAVIKTMGDAIMAAFPQPLTGTRAALAMQHAIARFNERATTHLVLKIGLHRGPSILVSQNDRIDYFGQTVNIAARVQGQAQANELVLSEAVYTAPGVAEALQMRVVTPSFAQLRGLTAEMTLYRATPQ